MMPAAARHQTYDASHVFERLMVRAIGAGNDRAFASMIATRATGGGALPAWLGLELDSFRQLMGYHFPGVSPDVLTASDGGTPLALARHEERQDLIALLLAYRADISPSEIWMAQIVAAGCMANDHLWHDLGLWNRDELTALMQRNFPALAAGNVHDMKWKRFLYKQLCETAAVNVCRAPSCEVCIDYSLCFGVED
ncbi:nitrogen fixation protein NifQ [Chromatium okenii]